MRVLVSTLAETGHFHPVVPIAQALQAAGHDVRFAAAPSFAAHVAAAGFPLIPAGIDLPTLDAELPELAG